MKGILYQFIYNPMIEESGWITMSLHKTRKGAEMAMKLHKKKKEKEWKKFYPNPNEAPHKFGRFEKWDISEIEIKD
jgi:hypothetical protein